MIEELKCSLICTFSGEGRRPVNVKVLEVVGLQCIDTKALACQTTRKGKNATNLEISE